MSAWIIERDLLFRSEINISFMVLRFSQFNPIKTFNCFSEILYSPILSNNVESHFIERLSITLDNSNAVRIAVLECTLKRPRSSS